MMLAVSLNVYVCHHVCLLFTSVIFGARHSMKNLRVRVSTCRLSAVSKCVFLSVNYGECVWLPMTGCAGIDAIRFSV